MPSDRVRFAGACGIEEDASTAPRQFTCPPVDGVARWSRKVFANRAPRVRLSAGSENRCLCVASSVRWCNTAQPGDRNGPNQSLSARVAGDGRDLMTDSEPSSSPMRRLALMIDAPNRRIHRPRLGAARLRVRARCQGRVGRVGQRRPRRDHDGRHLGGGAEIGPAGQAVVSSGTAPGGGNRRLRPKPSGDVPSGLRCPSDRRSLQRFARSAVRLERRGGAGVRREEFLRALSAERERTGADVWSLEMGRVQRTARNLDSTRYLES